MAKQENKNKKTKQKTHDDSLNDPEFGVYKQLSSQYNRPIILQTETTTLNGSFAQNRRKRFTSVKWMKIKFNKRCH